MRILVPTGIFHPESGGPATYLYHFLPELIRRGHEVEVITFGDAPHQANAYPYPVTRIPRTNIVQRNWRYYRAVKARLAWADKVFVNSLGLFLPPISQPSVMKIVGDRAWERAVNRGWIPPTEDIDTFQTRRYSPLIEAVKASRNREARRMDFIIVPSDYLRRMVIGWGIAPERVRVIYNALEKPIQPPQTSRAALGLPEGVPLLITAARLTAWKGVSETLGAIAPLPDVHFLIAGDGGMLPELKAQAEHLGLGERVRFLGKVPHEGLLAYYAVADYKVLYSGYEGLSHVILEALTAGTPVIASDKGGNPEVVRHGENGFLVPYNDVAALRAAIREALAGDTPRRLRQNPLLDTARFDWGRLVEETISVLEAERYP